MLVVTFDEIIVVAFFRKSRMTGVLVWMKLTTRHSISHLNMGTWCLPPPWMGGALGEAIF